MTSRPDPRTATTGRPVAEPPTVDLDLRFDGDGLYGMRAAVGAHACRLGADAVGLEHLLIVASELASNAVQHGGGAGRLRLWRAGDRLYCQVSDEGPGLSDPDTGNVRPEPGQVGGRGLWIIRRLSEHLDINGGPRGTMVTAALLAPMTDGDGPGRTPGPRREDAG